MIPLAPYFYKFAPDLRLAFSDLSESGDWERYFSEMDFIMFEILRAELMHP